MNDHVNIFKIERLRIETDGEGVRSLVCFSGCPLKCKYCLNKSDMNKAPLSLTPEELRDSLAIDDIYFKASSVGGVTFGGGEPSVHSEFTGMDAIHRDLAECPKGARQASCKGD